MSSADPWAVAGPTNAPVETYAESGEAPRIRGRVPLWVAGSCFVGIAALLVIWALQPYGDFAMQLSFGHEHIYDFPLDLADYGEIFLGAVTCAALLAVPRTRAFATGFGIGLSSLCFATKISFLRIPKPNPLLTPLDQWCLFAAEALALPTLICLLLFARTQARASGPRAVAPPTRRFSARRVSVLVLGLAGAAAWVTGLMLAQETVTSPINELDPGAKRASFTCCGFSQLTVPGKVDLICGAVVLLAIVVATAGRAGSRVGVLAGALPVLLIQLAVVATQVSLPLETQFGLQSPMLREAKGFNTPDAFVFTQSPIAGTWFGLAGFILLLVAVALLAAASRAKSRAMTERAMSNSV